MAETKQRTVFKRVFWWLAILSGVGNFVFVNIFLQFTGFMGLPLGVGVSASLTLMAFFTLRQRAELGE